MNEATPTASPERPLFEWVPRDRVPWCALGELPTRVEEVAPNVWVKRDDLSSPIYGGNKVRTLEALFGQAKALGKRRVVSTGAFGSNHALAAILHAPRVGLEGGAILFPQPASPAALENARAIASARPHLTAIPHWSFLPFAMAYARGTDRSSYFMVPGGATPEGALAYVSAGVELARQVADGALARPREVVVGVGSTCTSAGLLVGMRLAAYAGIGWREPPTLRAVRVTPWPVTSAFRIVGLAHRAAAHLASLSGEPRFAFDKRTLAARLIVDGSQLGGGYGEPTDAGRRAIAWWREHAGFELDTTYSAKAAAAVDARRGPVLFWSTKSTAPLPPDDADAIASAPRAMRRWIEAAGH
ncbi:MAG: pyridoxal-phosphate dependent enzyme [Sandaracinaceae bacterium]